MNHKAVKKPDVTLRLIELRKSLGYTQAQMGERLDVTREMVIKLERGGQLPSGKILLALIQSFNLSLDWLFYGGGDMYWVNEEKEGKMNIVTRFMISASERDKQLITDIIKRLSGDKG